MSGKTWDVIEGSIELDAAASEVMAYVADFENYPKWFPNIIAVEAVDDRPLYEAGKLYREEIKLPTGETKVIDLKVVSGSPGSRLTTEADLPPIVPQFEYSVEDLDLGRSRFHYRALRTQGGVAAKMGHMVMKHALEGSLPTALEALREVFAAPPSDADPS